MGPQCEYLEGPLSRAKWSWKSSSPGRCPRHSGCLLLTEGFLYPHAARNRHLSGDTNKSALKGQSNEIFDSRFFKKWLILIPIDTRKSDFEFCRIFVELSVFEIPRNWLPNIIDSGESKIEPLATPILTLLKCSWLAVLNMRSQFFASMTL
jgi:hypothetical protein